MVLCWNQIFIIARGRLQEKSQVYELDIYNLATIQMEHNNKEYDIVIHIDDQLKGKVVRIK